MTQTPDPQSITSRDNPLLKQLRRLSHEPTAYRKAGQFWVEGDHLCRAALARGWRPVLAVLSHSSRASGHEDLARSAPRVVVVPDVLFADISGLESAAGIGYLFDLPAQPALQATAPTVILDRVQDAGNVGSILRSAAAFGFAQVLALKGTAALWSPKVVRAGMGAHFGLHLVETLDELALSDLTLPLIVTSSHQGALIHQQRLPWPCAWVMGHEGQGVGQALQSRASMFVRIAQPGGEESLNVAAAAAICLHASAVQSDLRPPE